MTNSGNKTQRLASMKPQEFKQSYEALLLQYIGMLKRKRWQYGTQLFAKMYQFALRDDIFAYKFSLWLSEDDTYSTTYLRDKLVTKIDMPNLEDIELRNAWYAIDSVSASISEAKRLGVYPVINPETLKVELANFHTVFLLFIDHPEQGTKLLAFPTEVERDTRFVDEIKGVWSDEDGEMSENITKAYNQIAHFDVLTMWREDAPMDFSNSQMLGHAETNPDKKGGL